MAAPIIRVENVGKRYQLRHQTQAKYGTLRDAMTGRLRRLLSPSRGSHFGGGAAGSDNTEEFWALNNVSFEIQRGDVVGIIGRNGAGKSTLLKILSRITEPTTGRLRLRGRVASLLEVGTGFHPELTGRENMFLNGAILGMSKGEIRAKFDEIVAFAEVEKFLDTPVKHYSSGMYVRLAFAVAAHLEPEILIVDEVLAVGDAQFQQKCMGKMQDVAKGSGRTILFVSHNLAAVERLCTTSIVLKQGRVEYVGDTLPALRHYRKSTEGAVSSSGMLGSRKRPPWAKPIIQEAMIVNEAQEPCGVFAIDGTLCLRVRFTTGDAGVIRAPCLGIVVKNSGYAPVAAVNMRMTGDVRQLAVEAGVITCRIPRLFLAPGRYSIDAWLGDGPVDVDLVEECATFEVDASDVYGSGVPPFSHIGNYVLQPVWEVLPFSAKTAYGSGASE